MTIKTSNSSDTRRPYQAPRLILPSDATVSPEGKIVPQPTESTVGTTTPIMLGPS